MFERVLVANRGEIACRVMRTCRDLGIETVAVHSDADRDARHVREADRAVRIGPAAASASYLDIDAIISAAQRTGADAIHPGYGFLSENAAFARACATAGITFVGPPVGAIEVMGDKAAAKAMLADTAVPLLPGVDASDLDDDDIADACRDIGYPVLLKAAAGGGGKGMRIVSSADALADALAAARREAQAAFGDDRMLVERYVERSRHIEVQVFGDTHGNVIHLFERECSIQRRHQKVVEEAPSPAVTPALRAHLGAAAVAAARAVDYVGAGTVEFLVDATPGADADAAYFLEMNTRLQVEHPVTELITGLDLVEWQLRVAAGEPLPLTQDEVTIDGHAIEVRLYAEDPAAGFLPQTGTLVEVTHPRGDGLRVDSGVASGDAVSRHYDPMLAKLVAHGPTRETATARLLHLLRETSLLGVRSNLEHLTDVIDHPAFRSGDLHTGFLDEHLPDWSPRPPSPQDLARAALALQARNEAAGQRDALGRPWTEVGPWRASGAGWTVDLATGDDEWRVRVGGRAHDHRVTLDGSVVELSATAGSSAVVGDDVWLHHDGRVVVLRHVGATHRADAADLAGEDAFTAPMPGAVIEVRVEAGQSVEAGAVLAIVEAMKMEHAITAPADGTVTEVLVRAGATVDGGQRLLSFERAEASGDA